ncbi:MAG: SH3 domain-containing protein [Thermomicrobiales bacterium]|nr:SH3 domain-containing protein [Thermomicrobiales bacterium]
MVDHCRGARRRLALALLLVCALMLPTVAAPAMAKKAGATIGTTVARTQLRDAPKRAARVLLRLQPDTEVAVRGRSKSGFYPVSYGGLDGWVATGSLATPSRHAAPDRKQRKALRKRQQIVATAGLNVRAEPRAQAAAVGGVRKGEPVSPTGKQMDGYLEVTQNGQTGWVLGSYLTSVGSAAAADHQYARSELIAIVEAAAGKFGQNPGDMVRVARCESDMIPTAVNASGGSYGLFQFKPQTWARTPYAEYDIFDPRANAEAAAWLWAQGGKGEWVCQ